ncbi:MAG: ATPase, T2SS/T4P/T4SS family [Candidatus Thorarchaeota archaeon]
MKFETRETGVQVVICSESRCKSCVSSLDSTHCTQLTPDAFSKEKIILIERKKNLVHFSRSAKSTSQPPWHGGSWETFYIDSVNDFTDNIENIVDVYSTGPYLSIFLRMNKSNQLQYYSFPHVKSALEYSLLRNLQNDVHLEILEKVPARIKLQERLSLISDLVRDRISSSLPEIDSMTRNNLSDIVSHYSTVLNPLFPLFIDDDVEEIYLDAPGTSFYFDHRRLGRTNTNLNPTNEQLNRLVTLLRSESNLHLDRRNPSLKTDLIIYDTPLRFSISLPPLASEGIHLEIRRARTQPFTLLDLIRNGTLGVDAAGMLILAINSRMNITITGSPGVGKTTLMNVLDNITPSNWRKLYIEDAIESRLYKGHHQIRVRVDPVDEVETSFDKVSEIVKSLHRSPDYLILGEIQTEEHSKALFQSIAAGLHSIQTCHSATPYGLITRWSRNHGIDQSSIALMDLIVSLDRPRPGESTRYVSEIVEVRRTVKSGLIEFVGLNTIYSRFDSSLNKTWVDDGAFSQSALKQGAESHIPAFDNIVNELEKQLLEKNGTVSDLVSILWSNGNPMLVKQV